MAETVHLKLKANGSDIQGDSTQSSLGRENTIECISYEQEVKTAREAGTNTVTGRRAVPAPEDREADRQVDRRC